MTSLREVEAPPAPGRAGSRVSRWLPWVLVAPLAVAAALLLPPAYYWWSFRSRLLSLPPASLSVLGIEPDSPSLPPPSGDMARLVWRGVNVPLPPAPISRLRDEETWTAFRQGAVEFSLHLLPRDFPSELLSDEMERIGGGGGARPSDPEEALRRIAGRVPGDFRFRLRRGPMEAVAAELLSKLLLIPGGAVVRSGWSRDPPGLWVAYEEGVWALRILPDSTVVLRARFDPASEDRSPDAWVQAFGGPW
jgi:hypothetical protein